MHSRDSRYRNVADVSRLDAEGRRLLTTDVRIRRIPRSRFRHTVEANDRLDQLAHRYYRKPSKWWRIADANPGVTSPLALLGQEPVVEARLVVVPGAAPLPPWSQLLRVLRTRFGVEAVRFETEERALGSTTVEVGVAAVRFNTSNVTAEQLAATAVDAGFPTGAPQVLGRLGRGIAVPPDDVR